MIEIEEAGRLIARDMAGAERQLEPWQVDGTRQLLDTEYPSWDVGIADLLEDSDGAPPAEPVRLAEVLEALHYLRAQEEREAERVRGAAERAAELGVGVAVVRHPDGELTAAPVAVVPAGQAIVVNGQDLPPWARWDG